MDRRQRAPARPVAWVLTPAWGAARASALPPPVGSHGRGLPLLPATRAPRLYLCGSHPARASLPWLPNGQPSFRPFAPAPTLRARGRAYVPRTMRTGRAMRARRWLRRRTGGA